MTAPKHIAITTTAGRPWALEQCKLQVARFLQPIHHYVINEATYTEFLMRRSKCPTYNSQRDLLRRAIVALRQQSFSPNDIVFIIEDDDYYHYSYTNKLAGFLQHTDAEVIGLTHSHYYHLPSRTWCNMANTEHASLCNTAFRMSQLDLFEEAVESGEFFIDIKFWNLVKQKNIWHILANSGDTVLSVGMKGLPGIKGLGSGHDPEFRRYWVQDPNLEKLKMLVDNQMFVIYEKEANNQRDEASRKNSENINDRITTETTIINFT